MISGLFLVGPQLPDGFGFSEHDAVFTYQGRYAVCLICQLLNLGPGDEVLAPAYNCGAEIDPFVWAGAKVTLYRVDERAQIDTADIMRRVTPSTRLIYVSHFFGWPQQMGALASWCKEKGLFLVEDCALCLFSQGPERTIGRTGDAAIYSFVKSLPVPDGGALVLKNKDFSKLPTMAKPPRFRNIALTSLPLLKKWFMNTNQCWQQHELIRNLLNKSWLKKTGNSDCEIEREMPKSNYFDPGKIRWSMSRLSKGIISRTQPWKIIETRRSNYQHLHNALCSEPSIRLLYDDLPDDVCPLSFPIYVSDRNGWASSLEERGILVGGWPSYHRGFDWKMFPEVRHLKNDLLTLPVHQGLGADHMTYIAKCVKSIGRGYGHYHG